MTAIYISRGHVCGFYGNTILFDAYRDVSGRLRRELTVESKAQIGLPELDRAYFGTRHSRSQNASPNLRERQIATG